MLVDSDMLQRRSRTFISVNDMPQDRVLDSRSLLKPLVSPMTSCGFSDLDPTHASTANRVSAWGLLHFDNGIRASCESSESLPSFDSKPRCTQRLCGQPSFLMKRYFRDTGAFATNAQRRRVLMFAGNVRSGESM